MVRTRVGVNVSARSLRDARPALRAGFVEKKHYRKASVGVQMSEKTRGAVCVPASQSKRWSLLSLLSTWSMSSQVARFVGGMRLRSKARGSLCQSGAMPVPDNVRRNASSEKNHHFKRAIFTGKQSDLGTTTRKQTETRSLSDLAVSRSRISKRFGKSTEVWRVASLRRWKRAVARARVCLHGY